MNVSGSRLARGRVYACSTLIGALMTLACGSEQTSAKVAETPSTFEFAPRVGLVFRHEMKHLDELTVAAASFREAVEWRALWEVRVEREGDYFLYRRRLLELGLTQNGQSVLTGGEIAGQNAEIVQVMNSFGIVHDVTGTEQLSEAIASLAPEAQRLAVSQQFSPTNLRELLMARAVDAFDDVVGKPVHVGASWSARKSPGLLQPKDVRVESALPCAATECRRLVRSYAIDQQELGEVARRRLGRFAAEKQWDPAALRVLETNVAAEDSFVVEPATCHFHDALATEEKRMVLQGPAGRSAEVVLTSRDSSHAEYPPSK
jgi:hypothetical protein